MYEREEMIKMKRPDSSHIAMDRGRRAKQFAPFQALKGFGHSISEKETIYEKRREQSDFMRLTLDETIKNLPAGVPVKILYFQASRKEEYGLYLPIIGIPKIIPHLRLIKIMGMEIPFDDILMISQDME